MRDYVTLTFGAWDDDLQRQMHDTWFDPARVQIVEVNGEHIGMLDAEDRGDHLYVSRIEVAPEWQGRGIGAAVMAGVISDGRPVELHVFRANPKAHALYERLGFVEVANEVSRVLLRHPGEDPRTTDAAP
jgi:ribosomal protein S18 acetylase RimI-like enzyme